MHTLFGTDGIRGRVGIGIFVPETLERLGTAFGQWIIEHYGAQSALLIGHDTRESADWIIAALTRGILRFPITIYTAGVIPTPAAGVITRALPQISCSIILSASHNPAHDNGIKCIDTHTGKLSAHAEMLITRYFMMQQSCITDSKLHGTIIPLREAEEIYRTALLPWVPAHMPSLLPHARRRIVIDLAHGATSYLAPSIFAACNAEIICINNSPNGFNINEHAGATAPKQLQKVVRELHADIGFAFDGDGDRVIAVNRFGDIKDGDDLLCILLSHPRYQHNHTLVGTIMSNGGLEEHILSRGITLIRTAVGDKYISQVLVEQQLTLGGEPVGHIILRDIQELGDGILVALIVLETIALTGNWDLETFTKLPQVLLKLPITQKHILTQAPFSQIIASATTSLHNGRVLVRYSGTESLLRIMVEAKDHIEALELGNYLLQELHKAHSIPIHPAQYESNEATLSAPAGTHS